MLKGLAFFVSIVVTVRGLETRHVKVDLISTLGTFGKLRCKNLIGRIATYPNDSKSQINSKRFWVTGLILWAREKSV